MSIDPSRIGHSEPFEFHPDPCHLLADVEVYRELLQTALDQLHANQQEILKLKARVRELSILRALAEAR